jgi:hypothetical protein
MSFPQIAATDWFLVLWTALGWLLMVIFMVTTRRKLSRLRADLELLSGEVRHLTIAEESRVMREINAQGQARLETLQTAAAHLDSLLTGQRGRAVRPASLDDVLARQHDPQPASRRRR